MLNLGFFTGFGFGITEFFLYIFFYNTPFLIRIPGLLFHATNTIIVAYGISVKKPVIYYLIAVFLHFSYNFMVVLDLWYIGGFIIPITSYILAYYLYIKSVDTIIDKII